MTVPTAVPAATIAPHLLPTHVGVVMDGNRRWAKKAGFANPSAGHDVGADHVEDLLGWCPPSFQSAWM